MQRIFFQIVIEILHRAFQALSLISLITTHASFSANFSMGFGGGQYRRASCDQCRSFFRSNAFEFWHAVQLASLQAANIRCKMLLFLGKGFVFHTQLLHLSPLTLIGI
jgi:hypothetical protein